MLKKIFSIFFLILVMILLFTSCVTDIQGKVPSSQKTANAYRTLVANEVTAEVHNSPIKTAAAYERIIRYEISGNNVSKVSLTIQNDTGGIDQGEFSVPYSRAFEKFWEGDFLYISAQIIEPTSNAGSISCKILQGSEVISEAKASGFPSIATCQGMKR